MKAERASDPSHPTTLPLEKHSPYKNPLMIRPSESANPSPQLKPRKNKRNFPPDLYHSPPPPSHPSTSNCATGLSQSLLSSHPLSSSIASAPYYNHNSSPRAIGAVNNPNKTFSASPNISMGVGLGTKNHRNLKPGPDNQRYEGEARNYEFYDQQTLIVFFFLLFEFF